VSFSLFFEVILNDSWLSLLQSQFSIVVTTSSLLVISLQDSPRESSSSANDSFHRLPKKRKFDLSNFESTVNASPPIAPSLAEVRRSPSVVFTEQKQSIGGAIDNTKMSANSQPTSKIIQNYQHGVVPTNFHANSSQSYLSHPQNQHTSHLSQPTSTDSHHHSPLHHHQDCHAPVIVTSLSHHSSNGPSAKPLQVSHSSSHYDASKSPFLKHNHPSLLQIAHSFSSPNGNVVNKPVIYSNYSSNRDVHPPVSHQHLSYQQDHQPSLPNKYHSNVSPIHTSHGAHPGHGDMHSNEEPMDLGRSHSGRANSNHSASSEHLLQHHNPLHQQSNSQHFNSEMGRQSHDYQSHSRSPSPQDQRYHRAISSSHQQSDSIQLSHTLHHSSIPKQSHHQSFTSPAQSPFRGVKVIFIQI